MPDSYQLIAVALSGTMSKPAPPLGYAFFGGTVVEYDEHEFYFLTSAQVAEVADALISLTRTEFENLFDKHVGMEGGYPFAVAPEQRTEAKESCYNDLLPLVDFYTASAARRLAAVKIEY